MVWRGDAAVDGANERSVLQMPAPVPHWKRVSERAATATMTCLFHFPCPGVSRVTLLCGVKEGGVCKGKRENRKRNQSLNIKVRNKPSGTELVLILSLVN